ncbi:MAG: hypothetical protein KBS66_07370 [Eubacterium sp.]|nr:hypothetical protein [Candidatus Colimonas fimequi]
MAEGYSFSLEGLDELKEDLQKCIDLYPDKTEKEIYKMAGTFIKDVNAKMPASYGTGPNSLKNGWHRTREKAMFGGYTVGVEIENTQRHWHLVENGHTVKADPKMYAAFLDGRLDKSKKKKSKSQSKSSNTKVLGWAPGKKYCEDTRREWGSKFPVAVRKYVDKMLKGQNL